MRSYAGSTDPFTSASGDTYAFWHSAKPGGYLFDNRYTNGQPEDWFTVINLPYGTMVNQIGIGGSKMAFRRAIASNTAMPNWIVLS